MRKDWIEKFFGRAAVASARGGIMAGKRIMTQTELKSLSFADSAKVEASRQASNVVL